MPYGLNHTLVALILKVKSLEFMKDFRPISMCKVLYKLISKVLANRLKIVLPSIIHESHGAFAPGRLITDNAIVLYEYSLHPIVPNLNLMLCIPDHRNVRFSASRSGNEIPVMLRRLSKTNYRRSQTFAISIIVIVT